MYTVEFDHDLAIITTLDEGDAFDDVEVVLTDEQTVYIKQYCSESDALNMIYLSYGQWLDIQAAMTSTEGAYRVAI